MRKSSPNPSEVTRQVAACTWNQTSPPLMTDWLPLYVEMKRPLLEKTLVINSPPL